MFAMVFIVFVVVYGVFFRSQTPVEADEVTKAEFVEHKKYNMYKKMYLDMKKEDENFKIDNEKLRKEYKIYNKLYEDIKHSCHTVHLKLQREIKDLETQLNKKKKR